MMVFAGRARRNAGGEPFPAAPAPTGHMPIYEYRCASCDDVFEELIVRSSDERELRCPKCHGAKVAKVMSRPAAAKGSSASPSAPPRGCGPIG